MVASMVFDSDVLIWVFRRHPVAAGKLDRDAAPTMSIITYMELLQGARNIMEQRQIKKFLAKYPLKTIPLSENVGHRASIYIEEHALGRGLRSADALIAATAAETGQALCTGNARHFGAILDLKVERFTP